MVYEEAINIEKIMFIEFERNIMGTMSLQHHPKHHLGFSKPNKFHNTN